MLCSIKNRLKIEWGFGNRFINEFPFSYFMNWEEISKAVDEQFDRMTDKYRAPHFQGTLEADILNSWGTVPRLGSSIYTEVVESYSPEIPVEHPCIGEPVPHRTSFRAELAQKPEDDAHYLAMKFQGGHDNWSCLALIRTNDPEYVESHPYIKWEAPVEPKPLASVTR